MQPRKYPTRKAWTRSRSTGKTSIHWPVEDKKVVQDTLAAANRSPVSGDLYKKFGRDRSYKAVTSLVWRRRLEQAVPAAGAGTPSGSSQHHDSRTIDVGVSGTAPPESKNASSTPRPNFHVGSASRDVARQGRPATKPASSPLKSTNSRTRTTPCNDQPREKPSDSDRKTGNRAQTDPPRKQNELKFPVSEQDIEAGQSYPIRTVEPTDSHLRTERPGYSYNG